MSNNFTPLPLDNDPLSSTTPTTTGATEETLLLTPPMNSVSSVLQELETPFFPTSSADRFSSYSSISSSTNNSIRPDSFMSETDSTRPLYSTTTTARGLGDRRLSNLSNLNYGISEEEKAEEEAIKTDAEGVNASVLPQGHSSGFGNTSIINNNNKYKKTSNFKRILEGRGKWFILGGILLIFIVIGSAIGATEMKKKNSNNSNLLLSPDGSPSSTSSSSTSNSPKSTSTSTSTGNGGSTTNSRATTGLDGSTVYDEKGNNFIYNNTFGGFWNSIPFNDSAQVQSDVPPLNKPSGVNLGGWLVIEPFIVPGLFEPFESTGTVVDEWTLSVALGKNLADTITRHYDTFITEKDFAEIASAGLNWVRIPIPYWAIEIYPGEPFLANVAWTYFLKAIVWARKYGLRINLDLHAVPGSQNGYNHSSKLGTINFLNGVMGIANAQRTLNYIRTLTEFISQPQYSNVIPMFSILNEPYAATIGVDTLRHFYTETYNMIRSISGIGQSQGPIIVFHDGFVASAVPLASGGWNGFLAGADRIAMDQHPYLCFSPPKNYPLAYSASIPCSGWAQGFNTSTANFGISVGGEWSLAVNDCGKWINNVGNGARYDGTYYAPGNPETPQYAAVGSCDTWNDWENYTEATKAGLKLVAQGHMDSLRHSFFWTWKTGFSTTQGKITNPLWNYQLGLQQGYIPKNPRSALGSCASIVAAQGDNYPTNPVGPLAPWMTGGAGAGTILNPTQSARFSAWPPASIGGGSTPTPVQFLPTLTPTGTISTLSASTPTETVFGGITVTTGPGNGWKDSKDTEGWLVPVEGCSYPAAWNAVSVAVPTAVCTGA